jgi:hypothetical protein
MIEIAPEEYHKKLTWNESILYCFSLNIDGKIGWRIPSYSECRDSNNKPVLSIGWVQEDKSSLMHSELDTTVKYFCYPVRDVD